MEQTEKVQLNILLPINQRDKLRKMAAERNLENPKQVTSAAAIAAEILCNFLDNTEAESATPGSLNTVQKESFR